MMRERPLKRIMPDSHHFLPRHYRIRSLLEDAFSSYDDLKYMLDQRQPARQKRQIFFDITSG